MARPWPGRLPSPLPRRDSAPPAEHFGSKPGLSLDVLRASPTGASIAEIAAQVHLAPGTVRNYISSAMSRLGAASRHAAHRAWQDGWI